MKRVIASVVGTIAGLAILLSFKTQPAPIRPITATATLGMADTPATDPSTTSSSSGPGTGSKSTTSAPKRTATTTGKRVVDGDSIGTIYGPVQVRLVLSGRSIVSVTAINYPTASGRDRSINSYAIPQLTQEALSAQSAQIDNVSGASYTSEGFAESLQSALSKA